jgi:hypothetical protein
MRNAAPGDAAPGLGNRKIISRWLPQISTVQKEKKRCLIDAIRGNPRLLLLMPQRAKCCGRLHLQ